MTHDDKCSDINEDRTRKTSVRTTSPFSKRSREELRSLFQVEVKSSVEAAQREKMKSMSRNLIEENIWDVFATNHCTATEGIKRSSLAFVESVITETIHGGAMVETLNPSLYRRSRSDTFKRVVVEKIVKIPGFLAPVAAFVRQREINAVIENLKRALQSAKKIPLPPYRFLLLSDGAISDEDSKDRHSRRKCRDRKDRKY